MIAMVGSCGGCLLDWGDDWGDWCHTKQSVGLALILIVRLFINLQLQSWCLIVTLRVTDFVVVYSNVRLWGSVLWN